MELLIISGMSGAGKSRAAAILEDMDYYCIDNMPTELMPTFAEFCMNSGGRYDKVALVTDVRSVKHFDVLFAALDEIEKMGCDSEILYLEASVETLAKRYKETRRRHPLDLDGGNLNEAIIREMRMLRPVKERAKYVIDTSNLTLARLSQRLDMLFSKDLTFNRLNVNITSFGFKHGIPIDADLVFDVRFLANPYYVPELRSKTGLDTAVKNYVMSDIRTIEFLDKLKAMLEFLLPNYTEEGKTSLVICIGCTGGKHRSVVIANELATELSKLKYVIECNHRDINK